MAVVKRSRKPQGVGRRKEHNWSPSQKEVMTRFRRKVATFNATLHTAELLEMILSHLPPKDIMKARQVCKAWQMNIDSSPLLKDRAFITAKDADMTWVLDEKTSALTAYYFKDKEEVDQDWFDRQGACVPAVVNESFLLRDPECVSGEINMRQRFDRAEGLKINPKIKSFRVSDAAKTTYLTQPPAKELIMYVAFRFSHPHKTWQPKRYQEARIQLVEEDGITWARFLAALQDGIAAKLHYADVSPKTGRIWVDLELTRVWIIGSVFYNEKEYAAIMSGEEAKSPSSKDDKGVEEPSTFTTGLHCIKLQAKCKL